MESASEPELEENPDVWELFRHYDRLYFRGALDDAAFAVECTSPRMKTCSGFGCCSFGSKTITLYQPMLQYRTKDDLKNALLHLMIHAILFVKYGTTNICKHGPVFRDWMDAINACSIDDYLRPKSGYCITTTHDFSPEELQSIQGNLWKCESCGDTLVRATRLGPPSDSCCIENVSQHPTCGNMLCYWHNHKMNCGGTYVVPAKRGQKMVPKGYAVGSSSSRKASKSNTAENFQKAIVPATPRRKLKLKQEFVASEKHELFLGRSCNNAKSLGSCSSKKAEDFQKAIVSSASPLSNLKRKQTSVASEKHELRSVESFYSAKSSRSDTSRKASRWHKPGDVQKSNVQPAASQKKLKLEEDMTLSEKYGVFSPGSYKNTKPPGSSTSRKASKLHKPEGIQEFSVLPATAPRKLKQNLVASEKNELSSSVGRSNANVLDNVFSKKVHKQREPEETRKPIAHPAFPQSIPKQQNKTNSSAKAGKQHSPQDVQRAVSQSKLKRSSHVAPERQKTRSIAPERTRSVAGARKKTRSVAPGKKKEYACVSVWANIYESECSSGSAEPLVNKRTERRKRERERAVQITYLRSRKGSASGMSSVKAETAEEEVSSEQAKPPPQSQCLEFILIGTAHKVVTQDPRDQFRRPAPRPPADQVKTQTPRGQSQPPIQTPRGQCQSQRPAPCMDIVGVSPVGRVTTQNARGQSQPPAQCMNIVIPPAVLVATQAHPDPSVPSTCMNIAAVPPNDQVMARAPVHKSQPPAASDIATDKVVPPHSANPPSSPDLIDISDDD
ncbi:DNA-dependent metalloprotease SPRTN-like [Lolium rigidum]|uniref:DNA-dependent metalloprotease SPRTN-like n=1 Tax=Lolium rigidum TaxID=89674 RepID=UPI001F5CA962|nr:DNA-dependent metalloprotease SPRTN-like [Lolium rigidum]